MKAVILAAGEGKRLRPFTETMPKVMLPVANKPIIEHVVDSLKKAGINEIIIVVGYHKEAVMEHFKDYKDQKIDFVMQDKQLGTAHALLQAKKYINDTFLVLPGDNIIDEKSIIKMIKDGSDFSILVKEHPHPSKYGIVKINNNFLQEIVEKPSDKSKSFISTGNYKFPIGVFNEIENLMKNNIFDLSSVVQNYLNKEIKVTTIKADMWMDIVYPWDLICVNEFLIQKIEGSIAGNIEKNVTIKGPVLIDEDTNIYSGSYIVGPAVIGKGCEIGPNACIFPSTVIGDNSIISPFVEIRNCVLMDDIRLGSHSSLHQSVLAKGCSTGNNFSNILGESVIEIEEDFKKVDKIGCMIGQDTFIGDHDTVQPGVIIGRNCNIGSLKNINKNIESGSKVI